MGPQQHYSVDLRRDSLEGVHRHGDRFRIRVAAGVVEVSSVSSGDRPWPSSCERQLAASVPSGGAYATRTDLTGASRQ